MEGRKEKAKESKRKKMFLSSTLSLKVQGGTKMNANGWLRHHLKTACLMLGNNCFSSDISKCNSQKPCF